MQPTAPVWIRLHDRYSGSQIALGLRADVVVGAVGCEPRRYIGLTLADAKHYARFGQSSTPKTKG